MVAHGIGTALGSKLGSMAGGLFEVELEAMPAEAAEFEVARRYVNLAAAAARNAALARAHQAISAQMVARAAVASAARAQAPGVYRMMMRSLGGPAVARRPMSAGIRRPVMAGRYAYSGSPYRRATGRQPYRRPYSRRATTSGYQGARMIMVLRVRYAATALRARHPATALRARHPATAPSVAEAAGTRPTDTGVATARVMAAGKARRPRPSSGPTGTAASRVTAFRRRGAGSAAGVRSSS